MNPEDKQMDISDLGLWFGKMSQESSPQTGGEDFRVVLEETARVADSSAVIPRLPSGEVWSPSGCILGDGWSIAWRVHDLQFWGCPQRRARVSLVGDFGGQSAPKILFEQKKLSWDIEESGREREGTSRASSEDSYKTISFLERFGKDGGGKGILISTERIGALSTFNLHSVLDDGLRNKSEGK